MEYLLKELNQILYLNIVEEVHYYLYIKKITNQMKILQNILAEKIIKNDKNLLTSSFNGTPNWMEHELILNSKATIYIDI